MLAADRNRSPRPQNSGEEQNVQAAGQPRDVMMNSNWLTGSTPMVAGSVQGWGRVSRSMITARSRVSTNLPAGDGTSVDGNASPAGRAGSLKVTPAIDGNDLFRSPRPRAFTRSSIVSSPSPRTT